MGPGEKTKTVFFADDRVFWIIQSGQIRFNIFIVGGCEIYGSEVDDLGKHALKQVDQSVRQILVEQQFHFGPATISRRSRSAAKAKQARMLRQ